MLSPSRDCHRIKVWSTNLLCRSDVPCDAGLDCRVAVRLGRVVDSEGDVDLGLALVRYAICLELTTMRILVCLRLQQNNKMGVRIIDS
jgi:hypothetical protein